MADLLLIVIKSIDLAVLVLVGLAIMGVFILHKAQERPDFDLAQMLISPEGKASSARLAILVSLAISSWTLIYVITEEMKAEHKLSTNSMYLILGYLAIWSGNKVLESAVKAWADKKTGNTP